MRDYKGQGTLSFPDNLLIKGAFQIKWKDNGKTVLEFITDDKTAYKLLNLPLEGIHHRGGDDAWNISRILAKLLLQERRGI